jgi:phage terminase large subunit-like protein
MIEADDDWQRQENGQEGYLKKVLHSRDHLKTIEHRNTGASLKIKTFDMDVATGVKPVGVLVDELHIIAKNKERRACARPAPRRACISNPEAFFAIITTQSDEPPVGVMLTELKKARDIRDGVTEGDTLSVLYELPPDLTRQALGETPPWYDSKCWPMVTPNLGRSVTIAVLEKEFEEAKQSGEAEIRRWASQHLNIEIGLALRSDRWSGADYWESRADASMTLESLLARCEVVTIGIDGGGMDDLLAVAILGREKITRKWLLWTKSWAHLSVLERRKSEASRLRDFERDGDLVIINEVGEDVEDIADICSQVLESGLLPLENAVGVDPVGIGQIIDELVKRGLTEKQIVGVPQGFKMSGHVKTAERALAGGEMLHAGQPIMAWAVSNARVEPKGNAFVITKQASGTAKIDPLMATFDAVALMEKNPGAGSVYEERGLTFV